MKKKISTFEDIKVEIIQFQQQRENTLENQQSSQIYKKKR